MYFCQNFHIKSMAIKTRKINNKTSFRFMSSSRDHNSRYIKRTNRTKWSWLAMFFHKINCKKNYHKNLKNIIIISFFTFCSEYTYIISCHDYSSKYPLITQLLFWIWNKGRQASKLPRWHMITLAYLSVITTKGMIVIKNYLSLISVG